MTEGTETVPCAVCGGATDALTSAECNWCDARFHLNQRNDVEAKDCGAVWIDEQHLGLQFACANCLASASAPAAEPGLRPAEAATRRRRYRRRA